MRIFLDANILFSASKSDGAVRELLSILRSAGHELCADAYVIEEARRNLASKASAESLVALDSLIGTMAVKPFISSAPHRLPEKLPEKDRPVLEAAIRHGCDILVTGDRMHFGFLYGSKVEGVEILSPARLAEKLIR